MRINGSTEQAAFVLVMLALQQDRRPVRSRTLSTALGVSDSYLKKVLKAMADAGLVHSAPGRDGGYALARPVDDYTYGDVVEALDPPLSADLPAALARSVYEASDHREESVARVCSVYERAERSFLEELRGLRIVDLLKPEARAEGLIDWAAAPVDGEAVPRSG